MELIVEINVIIKEETAVAYKDKKINMLTFVGQAKGPYFQGEIEIIGTDTQFIYDKKFVLSARYMLSGYDFKGQACKIFVQNEGTPEKLRPKLLTDSKALEFLNDAELTSSVEGTEKGVLVKIFQHNL